MTPRSGEELTELEARQEPRLVKALEMVAPGSAVREGIDNIVHARTGGLIVLGDPDELSFLFSGGIKLDIDYTPALLYQLAKMDGAIALNGNATRIAWCNVQLMPDPTIASNETGTRHRTAERVAKQTKALVISISQQRETVTVFVGDRRYLLDPIADVLAKMDGAIIVNTAIAKIAQANVQLMPDPTIPSDETGTRHRTAERVARQTKALVVSISQQRETVTVFIGDSRYQLDPIADVLAKTNQALATLETYRQRLDQVLTRLTALEFQNAVMLDDVLVVLQRAELTTRMADYIERACTELGSEGRLIRMQLEEHVSEVPAEKAAIVYDYHADGGADRVAEGLEALAQLPYQDLLEFELLAVLGYPATTNPLDYSVAPRGYRVLTHIPRLPENVIHRLVGELSGLEGIIRASQRDLEAVDGVGTVRAREIREGLRRLQEHNLVDRYLQL